MGTPEFALPTLAALSTAGHRLLVVTQPPRRAGRGKHLRPSPVGAWAREHDVECIERATLRGGEDRRALVEFAPDFLVVVAFGLILRRPVLGLPRYAPVNLHPSPLPHLRGVAPIPWAIWLGDRETAVATMWMDKGVDTGDVLLEKRVTIGPRETAGGLTERLAELGAPLVLESLESVARGGRRRPQAATTASYAPHLVKAHGALDWREPARVLDRQIRALSPWPGTQCLLDGGRLGVVAAEPVAEPWSDQPPGTVVGSGRAGLTVATGQGFLRLTHLQAPGKRAVGAAEFCRGRPVPTGTLLGSLPKPPGLPYPTRSDGTRLSLGRAPAEGQLEEDPNA